MSGKRALLIFAGQILPDGEVAIWKVQVHRSRKLATFRLIVIHIPGLSDCPVEESKAARR